MCYGVLVRISPGYPPPMGGLHTRYAPVRRSPPGYCYPALPLDLHVLGLPLAFILSQDQTLHCKNCSSFLPLTLRVPSPSPKERAPDTRYLLFQPFQCSLAHAPLGTNPVFRAKADAKVQPFSKLPKFFFAEKGAKGRQTLWHNILDSKKNCFFSCRRRKKGRGKASMERKKHKKNAGRTKNSKNTYIAFYIS